MVEWFRSHWKDMIWHTEKISSGQTFTDILNLAVTLTLNAVIPFFNRTLWLMILYYKTKFGCKLTCSLEDTTEIVIFWLYKPLLWPGHWTQWTNSSAWHSGLWCCITIQGLVTKCSVVQKILSRKTFTDILNLHCDLVLKCSNALFPQITPAYDAVLRKQVVLQTDQHFERYNKKIVKFWLYKPLLWP